MEKIQTFEEVKYYLKNYEIVTSDSKDVFYYKDGYVIRKFNGSIFKLKFEEFVDLYSETNFYLLEENQETVDLEKDKEYYGRIQRHN